jgi:hypothetical protein
MKTTIKEYNQLCSSCRGAGVIPEPMQLTTSVTRVCPVCSGSGVMAVKETTTDDDKTYNVLTNGEFTIIKLSTFEIQGKVNRVNWAEGLIKQLPTDHEGRNTWLLNYGVSDEAVNMRLQKHVKFDDVTQSAEPLTLKTK